MMEISDDNLVTRIGELARRERLVMVELLMHLAELERRRLHLELGYSSLFTYCMDVLKFTKASAFRRTVAARLLVKLPRVGDMLADGRLSLTTLCLLKDVASDDMLDRAAGKTAEQVRALVGATVEPHRIVLRVGDEFVASLEQARSLLSHKLPGAANEVVLHECMRTTIRTMARRKHGAGRHSRTASREHTRYITTWVRRAVWLRDQGCCTYVGPDGKRCGSSFQTEFHHIIPFRDGGPATVENLTIHCRKHNQHVEDRVPPAGARIRP